MPDNFSIKNKTYKTETKTIESGKSISKFSTQPAAAPRSKEQSVFNFFEKFISSISLKKKEKITPAALEISNLDGIFNINDENFETKKTLTRISDNKETSFIITNEHIMQKIIGDGDAQSVINYSLVSKQFERLAAKKINKKKENSGWKISEEIVHNARKVTQKHTITGLNYWTSFSTEKEICEVIAKTIKNRKLPHVELTIQPNLFKDDSQDEFSGDDFEHQFKTGLASSVFNREISGNQEITLNQPGNSFYQTNSLLKIMEENQSNPSNLVALNLENSRFHPDTFISILNLLTQYTSLKSLNINKLKFQSGPLDLPVRASKMRQVFTELLKALANLTIIHTQFPRLHQAHVVHPKTV